MTPSSESKKEAIFQLIMTEKERSLHLRMDFWIPKILFLDATTREMLVNDENSMRATQRMKERLVIEFLDVERNYWNGRLSDSSIRMG